MRRRKPIAPAAPPLSPVPETPSPLSTAWRLTVLLVFAGYVLFTALHVRLTPVAPSSEINYINAPDEAAHMGYVKALAVGHRLPARNDPEYPTYEWHQPPLYYALAAPLYPGFVRWLSLAIGLGSLAALFFAARGLFPEDPPLAALAAAIAGLLPMRHAITGAAGNDALIELLFTLTLLLLIHSFRRGFTRSRAALLGLCVAGALLTKATGMLLLPIVLVAMFYFRREGETTRTVILNGLLALGIAACLVAPWYGRNLQLYGEITPAKAFLHEFEGTKKASDLIGHRAFAADLWTGEPVPTEDLSRAGYLSLVANWTFRTFWAAYTPNGPPARLGIPYFMPPGYYLPYALLWLCALGGLIHTRLRRPFEFSSLQRRVLTLLFLTFGLVLLSFAGFIWIFFQTQGRYLYPALLPISLALALGYRSIFPAPYRNLASGALIAVLTILAASFLFGAIVPVYTPH